jgi:hypothetical protein
MVSIQPQRGFLPITSVVLVVVMVMSVMVFMGVTGNESSNEHFYPGQALFIAENGLERSLRGYNIETACNALTDAGNIGQGSFSNTGTSSVASVALAVNIIAIHTVIPVASTVGFARHGRIRIENEDIDYAALFTHAHPAPRSPTSSGPNAV